MSISFIVTHNETVLLAMADCQAKTDESAEIIVLKNTALSRLPIAIGTQAIEAKRSYRLGIPNGSSLLFSKSHFSYLDVSDSNRFIVNSNPKITKVK